MNTLSDLLFDDPFSQGRLFVLLAPRAASEAMLELAARGALQGALQVFDGGNRFYAYRVARAVRRLSSENLAQILAHIHVARAFTCYQMAALLAGAPAGHAPTLVLDFLDTFYDESAAYAERRWLLEACVEHLRRLSHTAAVVVSIRPPPPPQEDPTGLLQIAQRAADQVWFHSETRPASQPRLFE